MATISTTPRPAFIWSAADNVWYPIGTGAHAHPELVTSIQDTQVLSIMGAI